MFHTASRSSFHNPSLDLHLASFPRFLGIPLNLVQRIHPSQPLRNFVGTLVKMNERMEHQSDLNCVGGRIALRVHKCRKGE